MTKIGIERTLRDAKGQEAIPKAAVLRDGQRKCACGEEERHKEIRSALGEPCTAPSPLRALAACAAPSRRSKAPLQAQQTRTVQVFRNRRCVGRACRRCRDLCA
eukprot:6154284-Pleurochrysis_carterae.AAC.1